MTIQRLVVPLVFILSFAAIYFITGNKVNQYGGSDALLTLPTSQAIVQTGHTYLTQWENRPVTPSGQPLADTINNYQSTRWNNEIIDAFSPGPALLTLPITIILNRLDYDLVEPNTNLAVQNRLAFLTSSIVLVSLFGLCLTQLDILPALILSHVGFFGSSLFANMGLALFNLNYAAIFICWALTILSLIAVNHPIANRSWSVGCILGACLFFGFITRPSVAILIAIAFGWLILHRRAVAWPTMITAAVCLGLFCLWSINEYDLWLPLYLDPTKTDDAILPIWVGIIGNLVSPSRGMLIFMPWLILIPMGLIWIKHWGNKKLILWLVLWFGLLLIVVSSSVIWWGGSSFGPRVMAETIPGLVLVLAIVWQQASKKLKISSQRTVIFIFGLTAIFSVWVNSFQPFFNVFTAGPWLSNITGFPVDNGRSQYFAWEFS
ncbi:MAG: hypothetical protein AAGD96_03415, partial [Chloroflexota bacterium]